MLLLFEVITSLNLLLIIFLSVLIFFLSLFYYRRTLPDISLKSKVILFSLRFLAILLITLAVSELTLEHTKTLVEESRTAVLVDNSKSIEIYKDEVIPVLKKIVNELNSKKIIYDLFIFDNKTSELNPDSISFLSFNGHSTNISQAFFKLIKEKDERNYQNIIFFSDGIYNSGEKPIYLSEKLGVPVFAIGIGDPSPKLDISIDNIISNDIIYSQNQTTVRVNLKSNGYDQQTTFISLFEDNKLLEKKSVTLIGDYQEIEFKYTPQSEGDKKLSVNISPLENEFTTKNNSASKYVKVLSNKIKVLTIAGKPSYDLSFINQAIKKNQDLRLETLIEKLPNEYYPLSANERFIDSADVIFLIGFPTKENSEALIQKILNRIKKDNTPLFILLNLDTDFNRLTVFKPFLPFDWRGAYGTASQVLIDIPYDKSKNEILSIDPVNSLEAWNSFPPIFRLDREFIAKPESEILAYFKLQNTSINQPLIISRNLNRHRSIAFLGFNIWRLKLLQGMKEGESIYFERFINNIVKWLSTLETTQRLSVNLPKKIFDTNEKVFLIAQFYDESNNPISDAEIFLNLSANGEKKLSTQFQPNGNGLYTVELSNLEKGDYQFSVNTEYAGKKFQSEGKFSVIETELEFRDLTLKEDLLKQIAFITNGSYVHISKSEDFINNISQELRSTKKEKKVTSVFHAWNSTYLLIILIAFLSIEWYLRKKWGLL